MPIVKHVNGFCLWQTADSDYDIANSPFKGDILGDFIAACNAEGILPGAYYFVSDRHNEGAGRTGSPANLYFNFIKKQITELHTKYPGLRVQIFGGSDRFSAEQWTDLVQLLHRVNPQCVILDRTHAGVLQDAGGTVLKSYKWQPNAELAPDAQLYRLYDQAQTAKKSFWLTVGDDPSGTITGNQISVLSQLKEMIANPPAQATAAPAAKPDVAERLKKVKALYDQGFINKDDYDRKVKEIMESL